MNQLALTLASILTWLKWMVICVIATEAVSEIVVESKFFEPFHKWVRGIAYPNDAPPPDTCKRWFFAWFDSLTSCGYCLSVWVAGFFTLLIPSYPVCPVWPGWGWRTMAVWAGALTVALAARLMVWLAYLFTVHRLSNWIHVAYELYKRGRVKSHDYVIRLVEGELEATK